MSRKPNFFIIGAPKCGTTAMSEYLRSHPNVFMSRHKEPGFFSGDVAPSEYQTMDEYLSLFAGATPHHSVVAEASTKYILSETALSKIREFQPDAKVMAMLRNPTDLVYASHATMLYLGVESEFDFEKAWELQATRAMGKALPPGATNRSKMLQYKWIGSLGSQLENVLRIFPEGQVHFLIFDDFIADQRGEYLRLLQFLELPDDGRLEFPKINENVRFRSQWLAGMSRSLRTKLKPHLSAFKRVVGVKRLGAIRVIDRFNAETRPRPPLRPEFRRHLHEVFRDEVLLLQQILGRDLSAWLGEAPRRSPAVTAGPNSTTSVELIEGKP